MKPSVWQLVGNEAGLVNGRSWPLWTHVHNGHDQADLPPMLLGPLMGRDRRLTTVCATSFQSISPSEAPGVGYIWPERSESGV
jgi:hypothetical protein